MKDLVMFNQDMFLPLKWEEKVMKSYFPLFHKSGEEILKKQKKIISSAANNSTQKIRLNIFAFGNEKKHLDDLRELTNLGTGSFLSINTEEDAKDILLQMIKINSKF